MRYFGLALSAALLISVCGCSKQDSVTQSGANPAAESGGATQASNSLMGTYKVVIDMPEGKKDDPGAEFGKAMTGMLAGGAKLEIQDGNRFKLTLMGMPVEGPYTLDGKKITLTPDKVMGMTPAEAQKMNPNGKMDMTPMVGIVSDDFKTIEIQPDKKGQAGMKFSKEASVPKGPIKETVNETEKAWVGEYSGNVEMPAPKDDKEKQEQAMAKAMAASLSLNLKADNTFTMNMMFELEGTWSAADGKIDIEPLKVLGMESDKNASKPNAIHGALGSDGKTITIDDPKQTGTKMVFTKK